MAQTITIANATYPDVPSIVCNKQGGGTAVFADPSGTTAAASDVAQGKLFLNSSGILTQGTASGGGGSSYTLLTSKEYTRNQGTSTTTNVIETLSLDAWTKNKILYVKSRDKAGARNGYCYGSDQFFINSNAATGSTSNFQAAFCITYSYNNDTFSFYRSTSTTTCYGVRGYILYPDGSLSIAATYNSTRSLSVNGTFKVDIYLLEWPGNVSPFA